LLEFAFPGERLILERYTPQNTSHHSKTQRKTQWTTVAVYHHGVVVPLCASRANAVARELILSCIIPGLEETHSEYKIGNSRFDFMCVDTEGVKHLIEVKCCSLVEYGVAMFPDAPSVRAVKHLEELAELSAKGYRSHVLFVIVHGNAKRFCANPHTDPAFAKALSHYAGEISIHAVEIACDADGGVKLVNKQVPVDLSVSALAEKNCGSYMIVLELRKGAAVDVGSLGRVQFKAGWYVYAGSALHNLSQQVARHLRKKKPNKHWHIDYLTPYAASIQALPFASYYNRECTFASILAELGGEALAGFGCSDCASQGGKGCPSHLYYFDSSPMENKAFVDKLLCFRHSIDLAQKGRMWYSENANDKH
jgi:sugar fermentation stimulation protein A